MYELVGLSASTELMLLGGVAIAKGLLLSISLLIFESTGIALLPLLFRAKGLIFAFISVLWMRSCNTREDGDVFRLGSSIALAFLGVLGWVSPPLRSGSTNPVVMLTVSLVAVVAGSALLREVVGVDGTT